MRRRRPSKVMEGHGRSWKVVEGGDMGRWRTSASVGMINAERRFDLGLSVDLSVVAITCDGRACSATGATRKVGMATHTRRAGSWPAWWLAAVGKRGVRWQHARRARW